MQVSHHRRDFLRASAVAGALAAVPPAHAGGDDIIRVGPNVKLVAMADAFEDRLAESLSALKADEKVAARVDVRPEGRDVGFEACEKLIGSGVVLLCTPPHFRPQHLRAAIEAGKHVFAEKPGAVYAPGVRSVLESCTLAKPKGLSVVSGLCLRFDNGFRETVRRIHDAAVGEVFTMFANDYRGGRWARPKQPGWSEMTYQMRNWYNFTWLSGDFNVEQHVHFLDVCAWIIEDRYPDRAIGMGGRQVFTGPDYGQIYDHFSVVYEYDGGARLVSNCRQQPGCKSDLSIQAIGTMGRAELSERRKGLRIQTAGGEWLFDGPPNEMYQAEHDALFAGIRSGKPLNNGEYMARITLLAIMGRMAAYTGQEVTWEMALNSAEDLRPAGYAWDAAPPESRVAVPGQTPFR